jgi:hypothetical protein
LVGLLDIYRAFILIAHADRQTTSQGSELRPYNWDISVEGERWQSRSYWRYSRRKKWEGLSSNSHWWSTLFGKSPCLALYDRQVAEISYINGKPSDTRWANLREVTSSQNRSRPKSK